MNIVRRVSYLLMCISVFGCAAGTSVDRQRRLDSVDSFPGLDPSLRASILQGRILIGMTEEMVAATWGVPRRTTVKEACEIWEYGPRETMGWNAVLTFEGGQLVSVNQTRSQSLTPLWDPGQDFGKSERRPQEVAGNRWDTPLNR